MSVTKPEALHQDVWDVWDTFSEPLEGKRIPYMYVDVKGLVTVGTGNLVDPLPAALSLPWKINGRPATPREIREDWQTLKGEDERRVREGARPLRKMHHKFAAGYTRSRLTDADIGDLVHGRLAANVAYLCKIFPPTAKSGGFASFPADAQLAICSMAWAVGPGFDVDAFDDGDGKWPNFSKLVRAEDWAGCIAGVAADGHSGSWAAKIRETDNPGVVPRNKHNVTCFRNAALLKENAVPGDILHWPTALHAPDPPDDFDPGEADTEPAVPNPRRPNS